jgi:L-seryl-tRNA(Ser) seleniumtransferase
MFARRSFLERLSQMPVFATLLAPVASAKPAGVPDYFKELGVTPFINAAGTFTTMTASLMPPEVMAAIQYASGYYVHLPKLQDAVGARIAALCGAEAAMVTSGCAGALFCGTAGCVTGTDQQKVLRIPHLDGMKDEVLVQKSHRFPYDHSVRGVGVRLVEVESAEEVQQRAGARTAMMLYFNDATNRGRIQHEEWVALGRRLNVPTFIDAAADVPPVENLSRFHRLGFDLVGFSGGKGIRGPQSAGVLMGRKDLIAAARMNTSPNSDSIARGMKVNKEEMLGMLVALELYFKRDHAADWREWERRCDVIGKAVSRVKGVNTRVTVPEIANHAPHLELTIDPSVMSMTTLDLKRQLAEGPPAIEVGPSSNAKRMVIGVWMMQPGDAETVAARIVKLLKAGA